MKTATCIYFIKDNAVLMAEQQYKIIGLKGYGGGPEDGETLLECALREIREETGCVKNKRLNPDEEGGISVLSKDLITMGVIDFYNGTAEEVPFGDPSFRVIFYRCDKFSGHAISTLEMMNPDFYDIHNLPFSEMIPGDDLFLTDMFNGFIVTGYIRRTKDFKNILDKKLEKHSAI